MNVFEAEADFFAADIGVGFVLLDRLQQASHQLHTIRELQRMIRHLQQQRYVPLLVGKGFLRLLSVASEVVDQHVTEQRDTKADDGAERRRPMLIQA